MDATATKPRFKFDHTQLDKVGAEFYELEGRYEVLYRVTKPVTISKGFEDRYTAEWDAVRVSDINQEPVHFLVTEGFEHYGPKIYLKDEIVVINGCKFLTR